MALDSRALAWATLAHKALPQRALVTLLRAFDDPAVIRDASAATLGRHVPPAAGPSSARGARRAPDHEQMMIRNFTPNG